MFDRSPVSLPEPAKSAKFKLYFLYDPNGLQLFAYFVQILHNLFDENWIKVGGFSGLIKISTVAEIYLRLAKYTAAKFTPPPKQ